MNFNWLKCWRVFKRCKVTWMNLKVQSSAEQINVCYQRQQWRPAHISQLMSNRETCIIQQTNNEKPAGGRYSKHWYGTRERGWKERNFLLLHIILLYLWIIKKHKALLFSFFKPFLDPDITVKTVQCKQWDVSFSYHLD